MLDQGVMAWLRKECKIIAIQPTVSAAGQLVLTADPDRFAIMFRADATINLVWQFDNASNSPGTVAIPPNTPELVLTEDQLGQFITGAVTAFPASTPVAPAVVSCSYTPERRRIYDKLLRQYLSQYGAL